jgi:hypothetical protein
MVGPRPNNIYLALATQGKRTREEGGREIVIPSSVASKPRGPSHTLHQSQLARATASTYLTREKRKQRGLNESTVTFWYL